MLPRRTILGLILIFLLGLGFGLASEAYADPSQSQVETFVTPTPGPDGRIVYIVKEDDVSFWTIAAKAGISLEELYALNGIQSGDFMIAGMELVLGFGGPTQATPQPGFIETETPIQPSATPQFNTGEICVLLFLDENGNARLEESELALADGQISIVDISGNLAADATTTDDVEGYCFKNLEAGDFNVSAAVPSGYNPTTSMNLPLRLQAGDVKFIQFGAQPSAAIENIISDVERGRSIVLGVFGILLLAAAAGIGFYASRYGRKSQKLLK
jgi:hypothetical protein